MFPGFHVHAVDTIGAGNAFNGTFADAISAGNLLEEAVQFGQAAAALSVTKPGAAKAIPSAGEINTFLSSQL